MNSREHDIDLDSVRQFLSKKEQDRQKKLDERFQQLTTDCAKIIDYIAKNHSVCRIYQWGSLLDRKKFREISDIDIALEGVKSYQEFSAILGEVSKMSRFSLDMVQIERVGAENAEYIRTHGSVAYERK